MPKPHLHQRKTPLTATLSCVDFRGCSLSGATPTAMLTYETAVAAFQSWRSGADEPLSVALREAPDFVMAHVLQAYQLLGSRDPRQVRAARPVLARAAELPANELEGLHIAAISAILSDDYEGAKARLGQALALQPRDVLALQMAHSFDHVTGETVLARDRIAAVLPAWSSSVPGYPAVLAMYAFSLAECGEYDCAEQAARVALAENADDARAHHAMAHVFEMTERAEAGARWMMAHASRWSAGTVVATHCWWHVALFCLVQGHVDRALDLYDQHLHTEGERPLASLIDGAALLWRLELLGYDTSARFAELADDWAPHIDDGFCSFNDVHAMLAFVGARDGARARRLELSLARAQAQPTRHGYTTRQLGLPACRALIAFGENNDGFAIRLLANLPAYANRLGGSHAQRDVLHLTLLRAVERIRRPACHAPSDQGCGSLQGHPAERWRYGHGP